MHRGQWFSEYIWLALMILLTGLAWASTASASPAVSVSLVYFRAEHGLDGAHLEWQTATELNTVGFRIERASQANGPFEGLAQIGIVPAQGSATSGHTYNVVDETALQGQTYWYRLLEIENDSDEHELETVSLFMGATPTATIEAIATSGTGATQQPSVATATSTVTPTALTTAPSATATAQRAATQSSPTLTPTPTQPATTSDDEPGGGATRSVGNGVVEAAGQPTVVAQVTESYPQPAATESIPDEGYPESDAPATTATIPPAPEQPDTAYPPGLADPAVSPSFENNPDNVVGASGDDAAATDEGQQPSAWGRILLWVGFVAALIIFVAGVFFSIVLSTRKQRRPDEPSGQ